MDRPTAVSMFNVGEIVTRSGRSVVYPQRLDDDAIVAGLRQGRYEFEIYVPGTKPPIDEWDGRFLLADPGIANSCLKPFMPQIEAITVMANDSERGRRYRMLLLNPVTRLQAFVRTRRLKDSREDNRKYIDNNRHGDPVGYQLARSIIESRDIFLITNAPSRRIAISLRFRRALSAALPERRLLNYREYELVDGVPTSKRSARSAGLTKKRSELTRSASKQRTK